MNTAAVSPKILGLAFLFQFVTSLSSGVLLKPALFPPGQIQDTLTNIAAHPLLMRTFILLDMLTALGLVFLGAALFLALRKRSEIMALVALGCYVLEAALLAGSRFGAFSLLELSQSYAAGQPATLLPMASATLASMDFVGMTLHMLAFGLGGPLFYALLYQSRLVPRALALWGLLAALPCLVATLLELFGVAAPSLLYAPYVPFELVIGLWLLVRGYAPGADLRLPTGTPRPAL